MSRTLRHLLLGVAGGALIGAGVTVALTAQQTPAAAASAPQAPARANAPSPQKDEWMQALANNTGRWGKDDQLGAVNLVTADVRKRALGLARTGTVVSLQRAVVRTEKSAAIKADNLPDGQPFFDLRFRAFPADSFYAGFSSDIQEFAMHGALLTHLDALCHDSYNGRRYNGFGFQETSDPVKGCTKLGVEHLREGIVTRGIVIDVPKLKGVSTVPAGTRVTAADLEAWEKQAGLRIGAGDALFLYTGRQDGAAETGVRFDLSVIPFFKQRDIVLVGTDGANADHQLSLAGLGVYLIDNVELSRVAAEAGRQRRWAFLLVVSPYAVEGATGSLVNPLAIF